MEPLVVGIDVALPEGVVPYPNTPEGHQQLIARLQALQLQQVVLEASGGYERTLTAELMAAGPISHITHGNPFVLVVM